MSNISQWSVAAGGNIAAPPDGWPEGMARDQVNDSARENMAATARWYQDTNASLKTGGTGNAYTLTTNSGFTALADLSVLVVAFDRANTDAATIAVDSIPAKSIVKKGGAALVAGDIGLDETALLVPNTTNDNFELYRSAPGAVAGTFDEPIFIETVQDKDYKVIVARKYAGTIEEITTISESGTCTVTGKINTTALGGTPNAASTTEQTQAHATANAFVAGDDIVLTISANSSCVGLSINMKYTRTIA